MNAFPALSESVRGFGQELGQVSIFPIALISPARINDSVYRPVDTSDPAVRDLARSISQNGLLEPIVLTLDNVIVSGHRRFAACRLAGLKTVDCRTLPLHSTSPEFAVRLVEFNRQRSKTAQERIHEEIIAATDPKAAHAALRAYRLRASQVDSDGLGAIDLLGKKKRAKISAAKMPFLRSIIGVLKELRPYLPVSARTVHYALLNNPPLTSAGNAGSTYTNSKAHYKQLTRLLTQARVEKIIPMEVISDETRGVTIWDVHAEPGAFVVREMRGFLNGYQRNLLQSQPNHLELVGEKNTLKGTLGPVAGEYCLPFTTLRGFCSTPPKAEMAERFRKSGKEKLVLLILTDFDPEGEEIAHSLARDLRDEHGVTNIEPIKVALTRELVAKLGLVPDMEAKTDSVNYKKFVAKYGKNVFELESVPPETLQGILREAIDQVLDVEAFNAELKQEEQDAAELSVKRARIMQLLRDEGLGEFEEEGLVR